MVSRRKSRGRKGGRRGEWGIGDERGRRERRRRVRGASNRDSRRSTRERSGGRRGRVGGSKRRRDRRIRIGG